MIEPLHVSPVSSVPSTVQATTDEQVLALWLHGKSPHTARGYRADVLAFGTFVGKPIGMVTLGDVQAYSDALSGLAHGHARAPARLRSSHCSASPSASGT